MMLASLERLIDISSFDRISIGYPGVVEDGRIVCDPHNLAPGWTDFDWAQNFGHPVRVMNDACMQALGAYEGDRMLYLGLGTSLGTVHVYHGKVIPLALGNLLLSRTKSFEQLLSRKGLRSRGVNNWERAVHRASAQLRTAFLVDYVMLGGGNAKKIRNLPEGCRRGGNFHAFVGGIRMWQDSVKMIWATTESG
jgi:polyphosphate glucokinase